MVYHEKNGGCRSTAGSSGRALETSLVPYGTPLEESWGGDWEIVLVEEDTMGGLTF